MGIGKPLIGTAAAVVAFAGAAAADCVTRQNGQVVADNRYPAAFAATECNQQHTSAVRKNPAASIVTKMRCSSGGCSDRLWVHNGREASKCVRKDCRPGYQ